MGIVPNCRADYFCKVVLWHSLLSLYVDFEHYANNELLFGKYEIGGFDNCKSQPCVVASAL